MTSVETAPGSDSAWCFQCGNEYNADVLECVECGVPTTDTRPTDVTLVGTSDEEQLAYDLHEWSGQGRRVLDGMLGTSGLQHAWQGATLIVREADEEQVDELVRHAEVATMPTLNPDDATMVYELDEFSDQDRTRLTNELGLAGLAHEFDAQGDLVVLEADEDAVDGVFEVISRPPEVEYTFGPGIEGVAAHEVLSELFLALSSLKKSPGDSRANAAFHQQLDMAEQLELPFGFSGADWRAVLDQNVALRDGFDTGGSLEDDEIEHLIERAWSTVRPLV